MIIRLFQGQKYPLILSILLEFDQLLAKRISPILSTDPDQNLHPFTTLPPALS